MNLLLLRLPSYFTICVTILTDRSGLYASFGLDKHRRIGTAAEPQRGGYGYGCGAHG